jgi:hypothetical protein
MHMQKQFRLRALLVRNTPPGKTIWGGSIRGVEENEGGARASPNTALV